MPRDFVNDNGGTSFETAIGNYANAGLVGACAANGSTIITGLILLRRSIVLFA